MFTEKLWKIILIREFLAPKHAHMGGTYTYPQRLCTPPPSGNRKPKDFDVLFVLKDFDVWNRHCLFVNNIGGGVCDRCEALSHDNRTHSERRRRFCKMAAEIDVMRLMTGLLVCLILPSMIYATCGPLGFDAKDLLKLVCFVFYYKIIRYQPYELPYWLLLKKEGLFARLWGCWHHYKGQARRTLLQWLLRYGVLVV